jgi:UDP-N-acetylglucosamine--N-acetylmuramyl-(pentapeptide) pyrophosphoryl-undecaprenol N-acetylglucosamine transferase
MKNKKNVRLLLTGGHAATTALSVVEEVIRREGINYYWDIHWVGTKKAIEGKDVLTLESEIFSRIDINKYSITAGRLQRKFSVWTLPSLLKIPIGFIQSLIILLQIKPNVILSFGGYAALPVVVAGYMLRIPVILHDQTAGIGRANKLSLPFAKCIAVSRDSALELSKKAALIGNPVMTQITEVAEKEELSKPPVIFILGGSRGSVSLNKLIERILKKLLSDFKLIHITGPIDYVKFTNLRKNLSSKYKSNYEVYSRVDPMQIDGVYKRADIVISRAGANTVSEIITTKRPSILIPLTISAGYDQPANAHYAKEFGIAKVLDQSDLTPGELLEIIKEVLSEWKNIVKNVKGKKNFDLNASKKLVDLVEDNLGV